MSSSRGYSNSKGSRNSGGGSRNGGRYPNQMMCTLPVYGCNLPMRMYIANTFENQGRRFWCCRRWNDEVSLILDQTRLLYAVFFFIKW